MQQKPLSPYLLFYIGTEAELVKMFPVISLAKTKNVPYKIISSGQNDVYKSTILSAINIEKLDCILSKETDIKKSAIGLLTWFRKTYKTAVSKIYADLKDVDFKKSVMVVHGDTISTFMGASIGKKLGAQVAHVEAGLRSHHLFNPFPEEIDRILTSRKASWHFAPGDAPVKNLLGKKNVINTQLNTIYDSLKFSYNIPCKNELVTKVKDEEYFVFVLHRQENLAQKQFVRDVMEKIIELSKVMKCVIILHKPTEIALEEINILNRIKTSDRFYLTARMEYFDFMKLLNNAQFVITDGGSNQEELHYMGKPCLVMRKSTERMEGIGLNAFLYGGNINVISDFGKQYKNYKYPTVQAKDMPSEIILNKLMQILANN